VITGRDTWYTVEELAAMIGRSPKTVLNWAVEGRIQFSDFCGVKLISARMIESMITGAPIGTADNTLALELMGRMAPDGSRVEPEKRKRRKAVASIGDRPLSVSAPPETQP
jgi:hypothetical protein